MDGDGEIDHEIELTHKYITSAKAKLEDKGHFVHILESGWYGDRQTMANQIAKGNQGVHVAYIACHVNAGGGNYGSVFHDIRSVGGKNLAAEVGTALRLQFSSILARVITPGTSVTTWANAHSTIKGIWKGPGNISGVCFEPCFMDNPKHSSMLTDDGLCRIGQALTDGVLNWAKEKSS